MELDITQQMFMYFHVEFYRNRMENVEGVGKFSVTPICKASLLLHWIAYQNYAEVYYTEFRPKKCAT